MSECLAGVNTIGYDRGKECLTELKGISLRLTVLTTCEITTPIEFPYINQRLNSLLDKGAKVIEGLESL
jgi:hypothetical protein